MKQTEHYSEILKNHLHRRMSLNPRYSLRAFARDLGLNPARLSMVLNRKQGLSLSTAQDLSERLSLNSSESEHFCSLVLAFDARSKAQRAIAQAKLAHQSSSLALRRVQEDSLQVISDWYHFALLELITLKGFKCDVRWMASELQITESETRSAIERMERLSLVRTEKKDAKWVKIIPTGAGVLASSETPSESIRKFHRQIIEKAMGSVELQSVSERDLGALVVAVHTDSLQEIKEYIRMSRQELNLRIIEQAKTKTPNAVYCFSTQLFRLSRSHLRKELKK